MYKNTKLNILFDKELINDNYISIELFQENKNIINITLKFSNNILTNITTMKRAKNCLDYWIPLAIELEKKAKKKVFMNFNFGDGESSKFLSMDSVNQKTLIPNLYSLNAANKINQELAPINFEEFKKIWLNKKNIMYWRGSTTGNSYKNLKELSEFKRIEICKKFRETKDIDIKISKIIQNEINKRTIKKYLIQEKIFAKAVSENKFKNYKYYPDIPGNSLAWGTITK